MVRLSPSLQKYKSKVTTRTIHFPLHNGHHSQDVFLSDLEHRLAQFSIRSARRQDNSLMAVAYRDTWSRKGRRAKEHTSEPESQDRDYALCVAISVRYDERDSQSNALEADWVYGRDAQLFESFVMSVLRRWLEPHPGPGSVPPSQSL
jgi:hypothetical protein